MTEAFTPKRKYYFLHRWTGVLAGVLGVLVFSSGAVATFHEEMDGWARRGSYYRPAFESTKFSFDEALTKAREGVEERYLHSIDLRQSGPHPIQIFLHEHQKVGDGSIEEVGVLVEVDPESGSVMTRKEGSAQEVFEAGPFASLADFFLELHILLLMPRTLGLLATGFVGFALLVLISTGYLVHRPSPSRRSPLPTSGAPRAMFGKLHTWVGSWTLPYTVLLALTGTFFSFAGAVLIPVVALVAFGGDQEALVRTVLGKVEVSDSEESARLDVIIADARTRYPVAKFEGMVLDNWGGMEANAVVVLKETSLVGDRQRQLVYDGHTSAFLFEKPRLGLQPSIGNSLLSLIGYLHFGTLLGVFTKVLWSFLGIATCCLAATGLLILVRRSEEAAPRWIPLANWATTAMVAGLPLAFTMTAVVWGIGCSLGENPAVVMPVVFASTAIASGLFGVHGSIRGAIALSWGVAAFGALSLPSLNLLASKLSLPQVWADPSLRWTVGVDVAIILLGAGLGVGAVFAARRRLVLSDAGAAFSTG